MIIHNNKSLKEYNSFGIDANAEKIIEIEHSSEISEMLKMLNGEKKIIFLGEGCNVLFVKDFDGVIVRSIEEKINVVGEKNKNIFIEVSAGLNWDKFVEYCTDAGYYGLENLSLIPGNIGSSPVQNIGAYGCEVGDFIEEVFCIDINSGEKISFKKEECDFAYRNSVFKRKKNLFIYKVLFKLSLCAELNISYNSLAKYVSDNGIRVESPIDIRKAVIDIRRSKLPDHKVVGNAGSFFKNPIISVEKFEELKKKYADIPHYVESNLEVKIPAAYLIEKCGWKGRKIGNVGVHDKQALVLVNYGGGRGEDIMNLASMIISDIKKNFGIEIYPEVNTI